MGCGMDCKPSENCKEFILSEIEKRLKKETNQRLEYEESVTKQLASVQNTAEESKKIAEESLEISRRNEEAIKTSNTVMLHKLEEIKDVKVEIDSKVDTAIKRLDGMDGKIGMVVEFMQNRGKFERLLSWIPKKYRGPSVLIALGGIIAFVLMYGPTVLEIIKMRWGK